MALQRPLLTTCLSTSPGSPRLWQQSLPEVRAASCEQLSWPPDPERAHHGTALWAALSGM